MSASKPPLAAWCSAGALDSRERQAVAAARLGYRTHVFEPAAGCPAAQVANATTHNAIAALPRLQALIGE